MNSDIRLSIGWNRHPKIVKLKRKLGAEGVLGLVNLWTFAGEQRPDGVMAGMDSDDIAIVADFPGGSEIFVAVLAELRLIDRVGNDWAIHDWKDNNPWAFGFVARSDKAKKAIQARWDRRNQPPTDPENGAGSRHGLPAPKLCKSQSPDPQNGAKNTTSIENHTPSIEKQAPSNTPSPAPAPAPSPSPKEGKESIADAIEVDASASRSPPALRLVSPPCPYSAIVALYHEVLPELRECRQLTEARKGYLRQRWLDKPGQSLAQWRKFFEYVRTCPFLMGQCDGRDGRPPFVADLEWLTRPSNFAKVIEGKFEPVVRYG